MRFSATAAFVALLAAQNAAAQAPLPFPTRCAGVPAARFPFSVADGWQVTKIGTGLRLPRQLVFDTAGNLLVSQQNVGISVHTFGADGCINGTASLVANPRLNHGLALTPDGKTLYASSETLVYQFPYDAATRKVGAARIVVKGIGTGIHSTRTLVVVPQKPELLIVQVGSNSNWDYQSASPAVGRAGIKVFDIGKAPEGGWTYNTQGWHLGYGLRNEVGIAIDPAGHAWGVENSGDDFRRTINGQSVDIHKDNPAEELNYFGDPTQPSDKWFGYPTCFTVWDPSVFGDKSFKTGDQFVVSPNATFTDASCDGQATPPRLSFPAHSAPITNVFDRAGANMYVTFHGSWDRQPATGYKVIEIPFARLDSGLYDPVAPADSQTGFRDIMWARDPGSCRSQTLTVSSCFRLAGLAFDPSGTRLYVSSDNQAEGELFVLAKK